MEVFKKGNKNYIYYRKCEECGSIISFMKSEMVTHYISCPVCRNSIYVNTYLHGDDPYFGNDELKNEVENELIRKIEDARDSD